MKNLDLPRRFKIHRLVFEENELIRNRATRHDLASRLLVALLSEYRARTQDDGRDAQAEQGHETETGEGERIVHGDHRFTGSALAGEGPGSSEGCGPVQTMSRARPPGPVRTAATGRIRRPHWGHTGQNAQVYVLIG